MATAPKNQGKSAATAEPNAAIKVLCATEGFRRAGYAFGPEAKVIALADLTVGQLEAIEAEPRLITVRTTIDVPAADEAAGATKS
jgi:hypothetical protein